MERDNCKVYSEVVAILKKMEEKYVEKVPKKLIDMFENEKDKNYEPQINAEIPLVEQNLQRNTLVILAMLNLNYWCEDETEKQKLIELYAENEKKKEEELRKEYNLENLFQKKEMQNETEKENNNTEMIKYKNKKFLRRIFDTIVNFFISK